MDTHFDVLVVGSGFGGSVTALRLVEKGYRVGVLEAGRRFADDEFPKTSWDLRRFLWAPRLGCFGMQRITLLRDVMLLSAAGVGGGSLIYANTLYQPPQPFYDDKQWAHITDWRAELAPFYDQASRMLGVVENPADSPADKVIQRVAEDMGVGHTYHRTPVGMFFGPPGSAPGSEVADPYFGGAGPRRTTCVGCGACMTGCRNGAKNTLPKNYLHLAEQGGAQVLPMTTVSAITPLPSGGYAVDAVRSGHSARRRRNTRRFTAEHVVLPAGTYHTQRLLHGMRDAGALPRLSDRLGALSRTNSESIIGASARRADVDYSRGVAITSSFHPDDHTHIEPVRYGKGSNSMGLLQTALTDGDTRYPRWVAWLKQVVTHPRDILQLISVRRWSERSIILLVMQTLDNSLTVYGKRGRFGRYRLTSRQGHGKPNPTWIPVGNEAARRTAEHIDGVAGGSIPEIANIPLTAHFIGGCVIGDSAETGVIDPYHRTYGHPGLHVVDGSAVSANLGVNPSLTITAQAERAMAFWPNKGDADPRPPLGSTYQRLAPVPPEQPAVPEHALGALRLTNRSQ